jgi:DNA recombination protein RmuC
MTDTTHLALILVGFAALGGLIFWLARRLSVPPTAGADPQMLLLLQQRMDHLSQDLKQSLGESARLQQTASHHMTGAVRDVTERLVKIEETGKQVLSFSTQLDQLQKILTNPKQRGILGEYYLETLLKNIFSPSHYQMQYKFKDGEIVDAVVFVKDKIVPIDSKFSLENYNRFAEEQSPDEKTRLEKIFLNDLKNRILETKKYIRPDEGTMEFAFMFIPHESIYYDLLTNKIGAGTGESENLLQRAASTHHVIIVAPTCFSAYLQTVLQGLRALQIEEQTKEIRLRVDDLGRHLGAYEQYFQSLGKHLGTTVNQYNLATKELGKIDKDVLRISGQGTGFQANLLDRPNEKE